MILRGGGGCQILFGQINLFSAWARPENLFSCGMGSGKIYFRVNIHYSDCTEAITGNSDAIERSSIRWNY